MLRREERPPRNDEHLLRLRPRLLTVQFDLLLQYLQTLVQNGLILRRGPHQPHPPAIHLPIQGLLPQADGKQTTIGALAKGFQRNRIDCRHRSGYFGHRDVDSIVLTNEKPIVILMV